MNSRSLEKSTLCEKYNRETMNGSTGPKLLIPWIENGCDLRLYPGLLEWLDKTEKKFTVAWIHKSCEQWDKSNSKVFEDWAIYKGKKASKDDRDLKAAFRNALYSKKNHLRLIVKTKKSQVWQILSEPERPDTQNVPPKNKVTKAKRKGRPRRGNRSCNTQMPSTSFAEQPTNTVYATRYNTSVRKEAVRLPPCQSLFNVSPPTPPLQQTDVLLKTLDEQSEFFHLQESEVIPSSPSSIYSTYSAPSPVSESNSQGIQGICSPTYNAFPENVTHPETFSSLLHSANYSLDFASLSFLDCDQEQVVPMSQNYMCNYELNAGQTQGTYDGQIFHKQRETEQFSPCQLGMEQIPQSSVPENSLSSLIENMPRQLMLYDEIDEDIFKFLCDIPEMER